MENDTSDIKFQMRISSLNVLEFSQYDVGNFDLYRNDAIEYQSDFGVRVLEGSNEIAIEAIVKLKVRELDKYFGELKAVMRFNIAPFDVVVKNDNNGYHIPDVLLSNFFNIVAGTIRGILYEKLRGTILQNEVLPLIAVNDLIKSKGPK